MRESSRRTQFTDLKPGPERRPVKGPFEVGRGGGIQGNRRGQTLRWPPLVALKWPTEWTAKAGRSATLAHPLCLAPLFKQMAGPPDRVAEPDAAERVCVRRRLRHPEWSRAGSRKSGLVARAL